jgi:hypothetical protein
LPEFEVALISAEPTGIEAKVIITNRLNHHLALEFHRARLLAQFVDFAHGKAFRPTAFTFGIENRDDEPAETFEKEPFVIATWLFGID